MGRASRCVLAACSLFFAVSLAHGAIAQSFDCPAAKSAVEHLICQDKSLGKLDMKADDAYRSALDRSADPHALMLAQRDWLRRRDACKVSSCIVEVYADRIRELGRVPDAPTATYRNRDLGISINLKSNRTFKRCLDKVSCVEIYGYDFGVRRMLLRLEAINFPLEKTARDKAYFVKQNGVWMTSAGRFEPVRVEGFAGRGWTGLRAEVICSTEDRETGFHAAGGQCLWAVLSDGRRSILATTDGYEEPISVTAQMLGSLAFVR